MHVFIIECFVESIPQTHLTWILLVVMLCVRRPVASGQPGKELYERTAEKEALFFLSFTTSVISASLGMSRLLLNGPSKFIRKVGRLGGYCQWGFVLLILSIMSGIIAKAIWLPFVTIIYDQHNMFSLGVVLWIGVSLIPQLLLVKVLRFTDQVYCFKTNTIFVSGPFFADLSLWMQKSNDHFDSLAVLCTSPHVFHLYFWGQNRSITKVFGALHQLDLGEFLPYFVWNHFWVNICVSSTWPCWAFNIHILFPPNFIYPLHIFMPTVFEGMLLLCL